MGKEPDGILERWSRTLIEGHFVFNLVADRRCSLPVDLSVLTVEPQLALLH